MLAINPRKNTVVVEHANIIKRHTRPNPAKNIKGGIIEKEAGINASNVMVVCTSCGKHTRIGHTDCQDGGNVRGCKRCKERWTSKASNYKNETRITGRKRRRK